MFAHADYCTACLKPFHCRTRVINHARGSARCARAIADAEIAPPSDELVQVLAVLKVQKKKSILLGLQHHSSFKAALRTTAGPIALLGSSMNLLLPLPRRAAAC